jgi:hypothetical protein
MRYLILLFCILSCSCASVNTRIEQVEQGGIEKNYDYPYDKVFYAAEDAIPRMNWMIQESNFNEGYIFARRNDANAIQTAGIKIKKIDDNKTLIKVLEFHCVVKWFYADFFRNLDTLLSRNK